MQFDSSWNNLPPFGYSPQGEGIDFIPETSVFAEYNPELREEELRQLAEFEPEMALAVACADSMGLYADCAELAIWRGLLDRDLDLQTMLRHRENMPALVQAIRSADQDGLFHELYFTLLLPIVAAVDADEAPLALRLYRRQIGALEQAYLPHS